MRLGLVWMVTAFCGAAACVDPGVSDRCRSTEDCLPWRACNAEGRCVTNGAPVTAGGSSSAADSSSTSPEPSSSSLSSTSSSGGADAGAPDAGDVCERDERYLALLGDEDHPVRVYKPAGAFILEVIPTGYVEGVGALPSENSTPSPSSLVMQNGRVLVLAYPWLYALNPQTLVPVDVTATQPKVPFSGEALVLLNSVLMGFGSSGLNVIQTANAEWAVESMSGVATRARVIHPGGQAMVGTANRDSVALWSVPAGGTPTVVGRSSPWSRLNTWDDPYNGRALAYEAASDTLLVGTMDGFAVLHPLVDMEVPPETEDWHFPGIESRAYAAAIRDGIAWVASSSYLHRVDLSVTPPATLASVQMDDPSTRSLDVELGCKRVLLFSIGSLEGFDPVTLARRGLVDLSGLGGPEQMLMVQRTDLNVLGDDP